MELHKAIKVVINSKGVDMICNPQIINYLLDYQAFKEKPATKLILRAIIDSGYAENILALTSDKNGWEMKFKQYQHEFIDSCGYKEELAERSFKAVKPLREFRVEDLDDYYFSAPVRRMVCLV